MFDKCVGIMIVPFSSLRLVELNQQYANYRIRNINETRVQEFMQKLSIMNMKLSSTLTVLVSTTDCSSKEEFNKARAMRSTSS